MKSWNFVLLTIIQFLNENNLPTCQSGRYKNGLPMKKNGPEINEFSKLRHYRARIQGPPAWSDFCIYLALVWAGPGFLEFFLFGSSRVLDFYFLGRSGSGFCQWIPAKRSQSGDCSVEWPPTLIYNLSHWVKIPTTLIKIVLILIFRNRPVLRPSTFIPENNFELDQL